MERLKRILQFGEIILWKDFLKNVSTGKNWIFWKNRGSNHVIKPMLGCPVFKSCLGFVMRFSRVNERIFNCFVDHYCSCSRYPTKSFSPCGIKYFFGHAHLEITEHDLLFLQKWRVDSMVSLVSLQHHLWNRLSSTSTFLQ